MRRHVLGTSVAIILALLPRPAAAQSEFVKDNLGKLIRKIGFHASTSFADPVGTHQVQRDGSYGVSVGLAPGKSNGWRYPFGIAWFTEELVSPTGQVFGQLRARPIYGGIGYGWHFGKFSTGAQVQAGWSFNSMKANDEVSQAFGYSPTEVVVDIGNAFAVRPQIKAEYFITPKFTVRSSLNYVFTNPRVTIATPNGATTDRWNASNVSLAIGVGFYPFRR
jgi:hypothetical protein